MDTWENESIILSELMQNGNGAAEILGRITPEDFSTDARKDAFLALSELYGRGKKVDEVTTYQALQSLPFFPDLIRPYGSFSNLYALSLDSSLIPSHIDILKQETEKRRIVSVARRAIARAESGEAPELIREELESALFSTGRDNGGKILTPEELAVECITAMEERADAEKRREMIVFSPFERLNNMTGGLEREDLVILSAPTGTGKSAFAMNLAGIQNGRKVLYINSEMSERQTELRIAAHIAKIPHDILRAGNAHVEELERAKETVFDTVSKSGFYLVTIPDLQTIRVLSEIRRAKKQYGIELAIVDYIGRADFSNRKDLQRWEILAQASQRLKTIAKDENICVVMIAQLTSDGERLAGSSYMLHDADLWLNLEPFSGKHDGESYPWNYWVFVNKARNITGDGRCKMYFAGRYLTFTDDEETAQKWRSEVGETWKPPKKKDPLLDIPL